MDVADIIPLYRPVLQSLSCHKSVNPIYQRKLPTALIFCISTILSVLFIF